jgi:hypothetical protein
VAATWLAATWGGSGGGTGSYYTTKLIRSKPGELGEAGAALLDRAIAEILGVEAQEIEGDELGRWRVLAGERCMQGKEVRHAVGADEHGLAVDDGCMAGKASERLGDAWHADGVAVASAGEDARPAVLDDRDGAVAVVLDLVQPVLTAG